MTRTYYDSFYAIPYDMRESAEWDGDKCQYFTVSVSNEPATPSEPAPMTDTPIPSKSLLEPTDMAMIPDLLARVANTIVAASDFAKQINTIQADLHNLNIDLDTTRKTNTTLQETINSISEQRDEAVAKVREQTDALLRVEMEKDNLSYNLNEVTRDRDETYAKLADVKAERDNYGMRNLELEDELSRTKAKLAKFQRVFEETMEDAKEPAPLPSTSTEAGPSSTQPTQPASNTAPTPIVAPEPAPLILQGYDEPKPDETERGYYSGHPRFSWGMASAFDSDRQEWFVPREAVA